MQMILEVIFGTAHLTGALWKKAALQIPRGRENSRVSVVFLALNEIAASVIAFGSGRPALGLTLVTHRSLFVLGQSPLRSRTPRISTCLLATHLNLCSASFAWACGFHSAATVADHHRIVTID
jgi:hypothetical protein